MKLTKTKLQEAIMYSLIEEAVEETLNEVDADALKKALKDLEFDPSRLEKFEDLKAKILTLSDEEVLELVTKVDRRTKTAVEGAIARHEAGRISSNTLKDAMAGYIALSLRNSGGKLDSDASIEEKGKIKWIDVYKHLVKKLGLQVKIKDTMRLYTMTARELGDKEQASWQMHARAFHSPAMAGFKAISSIAAGTSPLKNRTRAMGDTIRGAVLLGFIKKLKGRKQGLKPEQTPSIAAELRRGKFTKEQIKIVTDFLIGKKIISESHYAIDVDEPLSVREVASNWANGEKPYDEAEYHAIYPLDDLLEYRDFDWIEEAEEKSPEEYNKVLQNVKELGRIEPVEIHVGKNGQATIADGNNRLAVAQQLNLKTVPVKFVFLEDEVRKGSKMTLEPAEISAPPEEQHADSYYMR